MNWFTRKIRNFLQIQAGAKQQERKKRNWQLCLESLEDRFVPANLLNPNLGVVTGMVYFDANNNGQQDTGDTLLGGVPVTLTGTTSQGASVNVSTKTDASGTFTFSQLQAGNYSLKRGATTLYLGGKTLIGNLGGTAATNVAGSITLQDGQVASGYQLAVRALANQGLSLRNVLATSSSSPSNVFYLSKTPGTGTLVADSTVQPNAKATFPTETTSSLSGFVYQDTDNSGTKDSGETGITGVKVALTGIDDTGKAIFMTKTTDSNGLYQFDQLRAGNYTVQVLSTPSGYRTGTPAVGSFGGQILRNNQVSLIQVTAGVAAKNDYNFGEIAVTASTPNPSAPVIAAGLVNDTFGPLGTNSDGITSDPSISGVITSSLPIKSFRGGLDSTAAANYVSLLGNLRADKTFYLDPARMTQIFGKTIPDGAHTLHLVAVDSLGHVSATLDVAFTLDRTGPATPTLKLSASSDTDSKPTDGRTDQATVTLEGDTTAGTTVQLFQGTSTTPISPTTFVGGHYTFTGINLSQGVNNFTIQVQDSVGNLSKLSTFFVRNQAPTASTTPLKDLNIAKNASSTVLDLSANFTDADLSNTIVQLDTSVGPIYIQLYDTQTPQTVANFLNYINSGRYNETIFHRLAYTSGSPFVLQGGGFELLSNPTKLTSVQTDPAIQNEFDASRSNVAGTLAMAKVGNNPNSATSQFFFNLNNNASNLDSQNGGFTVFGKVLNGEDQRFVNTLAAYTVKNESSYNSAFTDLPMKNYSGTNFPTDTKPSNFALISHASIVQQTEKLTYSVVKVVDGSDNPSTLVTATIKDDRLTLKYAKNQTGVAFVTVRATDLSGATVDETFKVNVQTGVAPTITSANSTTFTVGTVGSFTVTTGAATFPSNATLTQTGSLPSGVTFKDNGDGTATITGTPAASTGKVYTITITASNGVSPSASQTFTLTVNQAAAITSATSTTFTVGTAGTFKVTTSGFPTVATLTETGSLPSGVTFKDNGDGTATISGTPAAGTSKAYTLSITAHNGVGSDAVQTFTLNVNGAPTITSAASTAFQTGTAGSFTVTTSGLPNATLSESGALPSGVTFVNNSNGTATISGTPGATTGGTYPITITASNGNSPNATQTFTLTVNQAPTITSTNSATFLIGESGNFTFNTSGFPKATLTKTGSLPTGVTFVDNGNGTATLSGIPAPSTEATYNLTVTASNGVFPDAVQNFNLIVGKAPSITSADNTTFTVGSAGTFTITTSGYPVASLVENGVLPSGVTFLDNNDGTATLSGTPDPGTEGTYNFTVTASNTILPDALQNFTLTVQV